MNSFGNSADFVTDNPNGNEFANSVREFGLDRMVAMCHKQVLPVVEGCSPPARNRELCQRDRTRSLNGWVFDMDRRIAFRLCFIFAGCWFVSGCETLKERRRDLSTQAAQKAEQAATHDDFKVDGVGTADGTGTAHAPGRAAGTWSSEAREIESHFNVR